MSSAPRVQVELEGVSARYASSREPPLSGVSLTVHGGELLAVLGPNGAGKSTLIRVLAGVLPPSEGTARLFGAPLASMSRRDVARQVAVVAQSEEVVFGYTVLDVVRMGRAAHQGGWMRAGDEDRRIVEDAMRRGDVLHLAQRPVSDLSGGEQKRVALARALAQTPRVMLLDEPAAFLDVKHQIALFDRLAEEVTAGLACVVVMHDLNLAAQYATRVALLKEGRMIAVGGVDDVMIRDRLSATFDCDLQIGTREGAGGRFFLPTRRRARGN